MKKVNFIILSVLVSIICVFQVNAANIYQGQYENHINAILPAEITGINNNWWDGKTVSEIGVYLEKLVNEGNIQEASNKLKEIAQSNAILAGQVTESAVNVAHKLLINMDYESSAKILNNVTNKASDIFIAISKETGGINKLANILVLMDLNKAGDILLAVSKNNQSNLAANVLNEMFNTKAISTARILYNMQNKDLMQYLKIRIELNKYGWTVNLTDIAIKLSQETGGINKLANVLISVDANSAADILIEISKNGKTDLTSNVLSEMLKIKVFLTGKVMNSMQNKDAVQYLKIYAGISKYGWSPSISSLTDIATKINNSATLTYALKDIDLNIASDILLELSKNGNTNLAAKILKLSTELYSGYGSALRSNLLNKNNAEAQKIFNYAVNSQEISKEFGSMLVNKNNADVVNSFTEIVNTNIRRASEVLLYLIEYSINEKKDFGWAKYDYNLISQLIKILNDKDQNVGLSAKKNIANLLLTYIPNNVIDPSNYEIIATLVDLGRENSEIKSTITQKLNLTGARLKAWSEKSILIVDSTVRKFTEAECNSIYTTVKALPAYLSDDTKGFYGYNSMFNGALAHFDTGIIQISSLGNAGPGYSFAIAHEMGHMVNEHTFDQSKQETFSKLHWMTNDSNAFASEYGKKSVFEDFAEIFKSYFENSINFLAKAKLNNILLEKTKLVLEVFVNTDKDGLYTYIFRSNIDMNNNLIMERAKVAVDENKLPIIPNVINWEKM